VGTRLFPEHNNSTSTTTSDNQEWHERPVEPDSSLNEGALVGQPVGMTSMLLAMVVMALGLPLHFAVLQHGKHEPNWWIWLTVWLSWILTTATLWTTRSVWRSSSGHLLDRDRLIAGWALLAYAVSVPALFNHRMPMYFDVAAMAVAWIVQGRAQQAEIGWRFKVKADQLALLGFARSVGAVHQDIKQNHIPLRLVVVFLAIAVSVWTIYSFADDGLVSRAYLAATVVAAACPCALGIARSSAVTAGANRAAAAGWLVPSGVALLRAAEHPIVAAQHVVALPDAELRQLIVIARATRRATWINELWAMLCGVAIVPLTFHGPVDPSLPAVGMIIAWILIKNTNRLFLS